MYLNEQVFPYTAAILEQLCMLQNPPVRDFSSVANYYVLTSFLSSSDKLHIHIYVNACGWYVDRSLQIFCMYCRDAVYMKFCCIGTTLTYFEYKNIIKRYTFQMYIYKKIQSPLWTLNNKISNNANKPSVLNISISPL